MAGLYKVMGRVIMCSRDDSSHANVSWTRLAARPGADMLGAILARAAAGKQHAKIECMSWKRI